MESECDNMKKTITQIKKLAPTHYELNNIINTPFIYDKECNTTEDKELKDKKEREHKQAIKTAREKIILHTTLTKNENIEHADARITLFKEEECKNKITGGITFKRENCYKKNDYLLLKKRCEGFTYIEQHIKNISDLSIDKNYYEVCCSGKQIKLAFDLDDKENGILINEVIDFCELFKNYIEGRLLSDKEIMYEILISVEPNEDFDSNKSYHSYHIIYNVYTNYYTIHNFHKEIVNAFLIENGESIDFYKKNKKSIDTTIYSAGKYFRAIGQSKGKVFNDAFNGDFSLKGMRTDILKALDITTSQFKTEINTDMFVMIINKDTDIFYNYIPLDKTTQIYEQYNIEYIIPFINKIISIWINELTEYDLTTDWIETLYYIIHLLRITGTKWNEIEDHNIINQFLEKSQLGRFIGLSHKANNKQFIKYIVEKQNIERTDTINNVFMFKLNELRELNDIEIKEIYKHLNKEPSDKVYLVLQKSICWYSKKNNYAYEIKTDNNDLITRGDSVELDYNLGILIIKMKGINQIYKKLYDTDTKTIITNAFINWSLKEIRGEKKEEYNVIVNHIDNLSNKELQLNTEQNEGARNLFVNDWDNHKLVELTKQKELHLIVEAPTSCGKTYYIMRKRIMYVLDELYLKQKKTRRICVLTDTRSLANATTKMITEIFNDLKIPLSYFKNYLGYVKEADGDKNEIQNDNTLLLLVCVDSLNKYTERFNKEDNLIFTDVIIDEYQNISSGILKQITNDLTETARQKLIMNSFYNTIRLAKSVLILDADINEYDRPLLKTNTNKIFDYVRYIDYKQPTKKVIIMEQKKLEELMIHNYKLGKPQSLSVSTRKETLDVYDRFLKLGLGKQNAIVVMNGEGAKDSREDETTESDNLKSKLCADTTLWRNYTLIIYNSTITTGISENTAIGEIPHFYTHYSLLVANTVKTPNAVAKAQMDMRVRKTQSEIMRVAIKGNIMTTLQIKPKKDYDFIIKKQVAEIKNLIYRQSKNCFNKDKTDITLPPKLQEHLITIKNLKETSLSYKSTAEEKANATASLKDSLKKLNDWDKEEQLFLELSTRKSKNIDYHNGEFIAIYLKLLKKWGIEKITTELYDNITEEELEEIKQQEKDKYFYTTEQQEFEMFNVERKLYDYNNDNNENNDKNNRELLSIGYSQYQARIYGKKEPYFNAVAYNLIKTKNSTADARNGYTRLFDYYYYDIMREMLIKSVLKDMNDKSVKELNRTDIILKRDIIYICNACLMFELIKKGHLRKNINEYYNYKEFMTDIVEEQKGDLFLYNTEELKNGLIAELKPLYKYLFVSGKLETVKIGNFENISVYEYINESFNYFNTLTHIDKEKKTLSFNAKRGNPYRLQKENYDIERERINMPNLLITNTDIDEYNQVIKSNTITEYLTDSHMNISKRYMPKIQSKAHKINTRIYDLITHYVAKDKQKPLYDKLVVIHNNYKNTHIKISYEDAKEIQDDYDRIYEEAKINEDDYYNTVGGIKANAIIKGTVMKEAKRFYNWKVCNNGGVYNEKDEPQKIIIIKNSRPFYTERYDINYKQGVKYENAYEVNESYVVYRNRLFNLKYVIAEAFMSEYDSEKSYVIPIDQDHNNNALSNLRIINNEEEFKIYKKEILDSFYKIKKYNNKQKNKETRRKKANIKVACEICNVLYTTTNKTKHDKTAKHLKSLKNK